MPDRGHLPAHLQIGSGAEDLARVYPWLDEAIQPCRLPDALSHAMHVALEEAVQNVAMHAGEPEIIEVTFLLSERIATLVVADNGREFDPTAAPVTNPATRLQQGEPGGLGLTLLRHYCDDIRYERVGERNRLTLRFPLPLV